MIVHSNVKDGKISFFYKRSVNEERQKAWIHAATTFLPEVFKP